MTLRRSPLVLVFAGAAAVLLAPEATQAQPGRPPAANDLQAFPPAQPGQARRVIRLPPQRDEDSRRVGLVIGRTQWVDCNRHVLPARIEERTAAGWGYTYHVVTVTGPTAGTLMACPTNSRRRQFVRAAEEPMLRYNSRVPLVVFAPTDVEVRYRIWQAGPEAAAR